MQSSQAIDNIQSALTGGVTSGTQQTQQLIDSFMPLLQAFLVASTILSVLFVIYLIVSIVQKQREHKAILRMDKNLQILVERQNMHTTDIVSNSQETS